MCFRIYTQTRISTYMRDHTYCAVEKSLQIPAKPSDREFLSIVTAFQDLWLMVENHVCIRIPV